jgi:hypothetical protein
MSFVLEALQKREAETDPDAAVSLARAGMERRRHRLWLLLFCVAVAFNLGLVSWLILGPAEVDQPLPASAASEPVAAAEPASVMPSLTVTRESDAVEVAAPASPPPARPRPPPAPTRIALRDLPAPVRARLPGLAFSTHIYAEDADLRAVVANGQRLTEGDRIHEVGIHEITEFGVVLAFERYLIEVPVFTDWEAL